MDLLPTLKNAVDVPWFLGIDIVGTVAFAISGLVLARRDHYSLFGAFVLAALPAAGGGILRDLVLGRAPVAFARTPLYLSLIVATVGTGYLVFLLVDLLPDRIHASRKARCARHAALVIEVFDALGLASFIVTGVVVAVEMDATPLVLWGPLSAISTAAGGGILRDIVRADKDNPALKRTFYSEVAFLWGLIFSAFLVAGETTLGDRVVTLAIVATMVGAFTTRMLAVAFHWKSPSFSPRADTAPTPERLPGPETAVQRPRRSPTLESTLVLAGRRLTA